MYSVGIAYLLWFLSFFGIIGLHRFYLGKIGTGILWMCTGGLAGIGTIYDLFTLPRQVQEANIRRAFHNSLKKKRRASGEADWRYVDDGEARVVKNKEKESLERIILKLAKEKKGILTVSDVALAAEISVDDAKEKLDALVSKGIAELRVRKTGTLVYVIPDIMDKDEPLEDF